MNAPEPGWLPDPAGRHQYRYWDGAGWTDNVADGGVASTDAIDPRGTGGPVDGSPSYGGDATVPAGSPGWAAPADSTQQYPAAPGPQGPRYPPSYGAAPQPPDRRRPPAGLIAALAVVAVALIGGLVYFLTRDDDDGDTADDGTEISGDDATTTEPDDGNDSEGGDSDTTEPEDGSDTTAPDDEGLESDDFLVETFAEALEQGAGGAITHEQALCASEGLIDELGLEELVDLGANDATPFDDPELASQLLEIFDDCGVPPDVLAGIEG
jgi:hypothetical protein